MSDSLSDLFGIESASYEREIGGKIVKVTLPGNAAEWTATALAAHFAGKTGKASRKELVPASPIKDETIKIKGTEGAHVGNHESRFWARVAQNGATQTETSSLPNVPQPIAERMNGDNGDKPNGKPRKLASV